MRARERGDSGRTAKVLAAIFSVNPTLAVAEAGEESPQLRVRFVMRVRGMTNQVLAQGVGTNATYLGRSLAGETGLTRMWSRIADILGVPQSWIATGSWPGEIQQAVEVIAGKKTIAPGVTIVPPSLPPDVRRKEFHEYAPRLQKPIQLGKAAFGFPAGTLVLTEERSAVLGDRVIFKMRDGTWQTGFMVIWSSPKLFGGEDALLVTSAETSGMPVNPLAVRNIKVTDVAATYVVVGVRDWPLRQPSHHQSMTEAMAGIPDDPEESVEP